LTCVRDYREWSEIYFDIIMKKYLLFLLMVLMCPVIIHAQELNPQNLIQSENVQIFTLSVKASTSKLLRVSKKLIVENYSVDSINLKVLGLCHANNEWILLGVSGNLVPYKEAKKYSTFSKKYYANIYESPYKISELQEEIDGSFSKVAILSKSGKKYKAMFQHDHSNLIIQIYDLTSVDGIYDDSIEAEQSEQNKTKVTTIKSDW